MIARLSEAEARAQQNRKRPARALGVDIAEALFDQPVHIRQPAHEAELRLGYRLEGTHADEHATGRTHAERPRLFEKLAILRCKRGREVGRYVEERTTDVLVAVRAHEVAYEGREAGACKKPPLTDLEAPILERGEPDCERDRRCARAHGADLDPSLLRITAGPHEVEYGLGARGAVTEHTALYQTQPPLETLARRVT